MEILTSTISVDGGFLAFQSLDSNLIPDTSNLIPDVSNLVAEVTSGSSDILGSEGVNTLLGSNGDSLLTGSFQTVSINGGSATGQIISGAADDSISVGSGDYLIDAGAGNDTIWLGDGNNTVVLASGNGLDTIHNFDLDQTHLGLSGGLTFNDLNITQAGDATLVEIASTGEDLASLVGIQASSINSSSFVII